MHIVKHSHSTECQLDYLNRAEMLSRVSLGLADTSTAKLTAVQAPITTQSAIDCPSQIWCHMQALLWAEMPHKGAPELQSQLQTQPFPCISPGILLTPLGKFHQLKLMENLFSWRNRWESICLRSQMTSWRCFTEQHTAFSRRHRGQHHPFPQHPAQPLD